MFDEAVVDQSENNLLALGERDGRREEFELGRFDNHSRPCRGCRRALGGLTGGVALEALQAAHEGQGFLQAEITKPVLARFSRTHEELPDTHLSSRVKEVLQLIADGKSNKQVATDPAISEATVKTYVASIFDKLGAVHRAHAVAMALRHRLID